jgi:hypothetical protein
LVPDVKGGKRLRLRHGDSVRFERAARAKRPWIERVRCRRRKDGKWELTWSCGFDAEAEAEVWIQWSNDRGKSWNALAVGVQTQRHVFDAALLPAGSVEFRVLAHDGFSTASAQTDAIRVPVRPPEVAILHPSGPEATLQGAELLLWGDAVDCHGEPLPDEQLEWRMDGKTVGTGPELLLSAAALASTLRARHELGLVARDRHGESRTSITLHTPRPRSKRG